MFMRLLASATLLLALGVSTTAHATADSMSKQDLAAYESQVNKDVAAGTKYSEISPSDLDTVKKKFAAIDDRWEHADGAGNLSPSDQSADESDLAAIDKILHRAAVDSRLVCTDAPPIGTMISHRVCKTQAQVQREESTAQEEGRELQAPKAQPQMMH